MPQPPSNPRYISQSMLPLPAQPRPKVLRIGVVLGDKIVEERLLREREPVTIGQSAKNTFAIPTPELPKSWTLFQLIGGKYVLNVADTMDGRLSDGGQVTTMAQVKTSGKAQRQGQAWQVPLSDGARGKIIIGDMTLLFQFVLAPPLQPRPQLPHSVRGSIADSIDPYMAVTSAVSVLAFGVFFVWVKYFVEEPKPLAPDEIPEQFARVLMDKPKALQPPADTNKGKGAEEKVDEKPKKDVAKDDGGDTVAKDDSPKVASPAPSAAERAAAAEQKVKNSAVMRVLGAAGGSGGRGTFLDVSGGKDIGGSLDKGLMNVGRDGAAVAVVGGEGLGTGVRGGSDGAIAEGTHTGVKGPTGPASTGKEKAEEEVKVSGSTGDADGDSSGELNPEVFETTIKNRYYSRAVQCYQRALKTNPTIGGKVEVSITVGPAGNVIGASASGFDGGVDQCIEAEARRWRFPKPEEASKFEFSFIFRRAG